MGLLTFLLFGYAWKGTYSRYLQDDYCYGAEVGRLGFFPAQIDSYMTPMPYNSNRYSLTLFSGIAEVLGGPAFSPFITCLAILGWAAAFFYTARQWQRWRGAAGDPWITCIGVLAVLFFSLFLAPSQYQVVFWRSAMLPYWMPVILTVFILGLCLKLAQRGSLNLLGGISIGLLGFVAGGFSETAAAWQLTLFGLLFLYAFINRSSWKRMYLSLIWALGGILLALLILAICPANLQRIQSLGMQQPDFRTLAFKSFQFGYTYIRYTIRTKLLDFIAIAALGFWLGWKAKLESKISPLRMMIGGLATGAGCYLLAVASALPTLYTMSSPPDGRALFPAQVSLILAVFIAGWLAAQIIFSWKPDLKQNHVVNGFSIVIGLLLCGYFITCFPGAYADVSAFRSRAYYWDLRQDLMRASIKAGEQDLQVPEFNSLNQVAELRPDAHFWVNTCAARYYQVHSISAQEGYLGFPADFK